jgi:tetratricopeptide (TPR) repeat protein
VFLAELVAEGSVRVTRLAGVLVLVMLSVSVAIRPAAGYEQDVHLTLTKYLAQWAGFSESEATEVAKANQELDSNPAFSAMPEITGNCFRLIGNECKAIALGAINKKVLDDWVAKWKSDPSYQRILSAQRAYHFPDQKRLADLRRSAFGNKNLKTFGHYLHALQDSFSHSIMDYSSLASLREFDFDRLLASLGYLPDREVMGHTFYWHSVDKTSERPELAEMMARYVYKELTAFKGTPNRYGEIEAVVMRFVRETDDTRRTALLTKLPSAEKPVRSGETVAGAPELTFRMKDWSTVSGQLKDESIKVKSSVGTATVPVKDIVSFSAGELRLKDGNVLKGELVASSLAVASKYGTLLLNAKDMVWFGVGSPPAVAAAAPTPAPQAPAAKPPAPAASAPGPTVSGGSIVSSIEGTWVILKEPFWISNAHLARGNRNFQFLNDGTAIWGTATGTYAKQGANRVKVQFPMQAATPGYVGVLEFAIEGDKLTLKSLAEDDPIVLGRASSPLVSAENEKEQECNQLVASAKRALLTAMTRQPGLVSEEDLAIVYAVNRDGSLNRVFGTWESCIEWAQGILNKLGPGQARGSSGPTASLPKPGETKQGATPSAEGLLAQIGQEEQRRIAQYPADSQRWISRRSQYGRQAMQKNDWKRARSEYKGIVDKYDAQNFGAHVNLSGVYAMLNEVENAKKHFDVASQRAPRYVIPYVNMVYAYARSGNTEEALKYLEKVVELRYGDLARFRNDTDLPTEFREHPKVKELVAKGS